jgi:hypothetical protein
MDKCSLGDDPDIRKLSRNVLEVLESEDSQVMQSPNMLGMVPRNYGHMNHRKE